MDIKVFKERLNIAGYISFVPNGYSMYPFLKGNGQSVIIKKCDTTLKKYDIALFFRNNNQAVLHRIIEVHDDYYVMQGDSQLFTENVEKQNVIGVVTSIFRGKKEIDINCERYKKKVARYYEKKLLRRIRLKIFRTYVAIKNHYRGRL